MPKNGSWLHGRYFLHALAATLLSSAENSAMVPTARRAKAFPARWALDCQAAIEKCSSRRRPSVSWTVSSVSLCSHSYEPRRRVQIQSRARSCCGVQRCIDRVQPYDGWYSSPRPDGISIEMDHSSHVECLAAHLAPVPHCVASVTTNESIEVERCRHTAACRRIEKKSVQSLTAFSPCTAFLSVSCCDTKSACPQSTTRWTYFPQVQQPTASLRRCMELSQTRHVGGRHCLSPRMCYEHCLQPQHDETTRCLACVSGSAARKPLRPSNMSLHVDQSARLNDERARRCAEAQHLPQQDARPVTFARGCRPAFQQELLARSSGRKHADTPNHVPW